MDYYCFELKPTSDSDLLWDELTKDGYQLLYAMEEPGIAHKIYGFLPEKFTALHEGIATASPQTFEHIDWQEQWRDAAGGNNDGTLKLNLADYVVGCKKTVTLFPGPGFGDLSHPTTKQILQLMAPHVSGKFFLDIGCGSGILAIAAAQLGALQVHGIDIDAGALEHARSNAIMNELDTVVTFGFPSKNFELKTEEPILIAMNMISAEQKKAWEYLSECHNLSADIFTSGVLEEQREEYLIQCETWGWRLIAESSLEGWKAFRFKTRI